MAETIIYQQQSLWNKTWKDRQGRVVIWQTPNIPLGVWVVATVLSLFTAGKLSSSLSLIASASLLIWSGLEIIKGVNYFRRGLGILVLVFSIMSVINNITHF